MDSVSEKELLGKIQASGKPAAFVRAHSKGWNHEDWLKYRDGITAEFGQISDAALGGMLEEERFMLRKRWRKDKILAHIQRRAGKGPVNSYYYAEKFPKVHAAAARIFGSWKNALSAAGIDYSAVVKYKRWTPEAVLDGIRKRAAAGEDISSNSMQAQNKPLYMAAVKRFKNWGSAVSAAGLNYGSVRKRRKMTPEETAAEIKRLAGQNVDLSYTNMRKNYQFLMAAAMKKLGGGSWAEARKACGVTKSFRGRKAAAL
jgi:hypothetical protein